MIRLSAALGRLARMDTREVGFRARSEAHKARDRVRHAVARPSWSRAALRHVLAGARPGEGLFLASVRSAVEARDWTGVHRALARHLVHRRATFPLQPSERDSLAARIHVRFPAAAAQSRARADRILAGRYDLLGYRDLEFGRPVRWHYDPVHDREAPRGFWAGVPYLDAACGDHKVIWELNRHQHWLTLARAHALTGDRRYYTGVVFQLEDWLEMNPPLEGINWASMLELAFRALSWLWVMHLFAPTAADDQAGATPWLVDLLVALDRQLLHVERNLSFYFSPNTHLTGEALGLYVCGLALPELRASRRRAELGRRVLLQEAARQIHPDGGHAELSPHYHRYSTDFYLLALQMARASGDPAAAAFADAAHRQARYLRTIADHRGRLPLIGDDDGGQLFPVCGRRPGDCADTLAVAAVLLDDPRLSVGPIPEEAFWRVGLHADGWRDVAPAPWPSALLHDSGYFVSRTSEGDHLVLDGGRHGFLNGGHAHADALSVAATAGGYPLLVDPGTATYTMDAATRDLFRSTAMHNTVVVDGAPQAIPRGPFHWRQRVDASLGCARIGHGVDYVEARHGAYAPIIHVRALFAVHGWAWLVIDHLLDASAAHGNHTAEAFWHLHPAWALDAPAGTRVRLRHVTGRVHALACSAALAPVDGPHERLRAFAPTYGRVERAECLRAVTSGPAPRTVLTVVPMAAAADREVAVEPLTLNETMAPGWHAAAYHVRFGDADLVVLSATESDGRAGGDAAAPPARWGTADVQIVGRAAFLLSTPAGRRAAVVNGRHLASAEARLNHDLPQPLIRFESEAASRAPAAAEPLNL